MYRIIHSDGKSKQCNAILCFFADVRLRATPLDLKAAPTRQKYGMKKRDLHAKKLFFADIISLIESGNLSKNINWKITFRVT